MPVRIRHKVNVNVPGLRNANRYLAEEYRRAAYHIGDRLQEKIRSKQRKDTGQERRRTKYRVKTRGRGALNVLLQVYNDVVQGLVDETGAKPHFPPFLRGSRLFGWVQRKGLAAQRSKEDISGRAKNTRRRVRESGGDRVAQTAAARFRRGRDKDINTRRIESVAFAIARAISRRGLPRPGDPLRKPFETTRKESINMITTVYSFATLKAVKRVNDEGRR